MINILYNIIVPELSMSFYVTYDHVTVTVKCDGYVTVCESYI